MTIKLTGEDTGGAWALLEARLDPLAPGPPLHVHSREDEAFYVLEGMLQVRAGEQIFSAPAGSFVFLPRGLPHTFCNPSGAPARVLGLIIPGGFEGFFEDQLDLLGRTAPGAAPSPEEIAEISARYGNVAVGPPLFSPGTAAGNGDANLR